VEVPCRYHPSWADSPQPIETHSRLSNNSSSSITRRTPLRLPHRGRAMPRPSTHHPECSPHRPSTLRSDARIPPITRDRMILEAAPPALHTTHTRHPRCRATVRRKHITHATRQPRPNPPETRAEDQSLLRHLQGRAASPRPTAACLLDRRSRAGSPKIGTADATSWDGRCRGQSTTPRGLGCARIPMTSDTGQSANDKLSTNSESMRGESEHTLAVTRAAIPCTCMSLARETRTAIKRPMADLANRATLGISETLVPISEIYAATCVVIPELTLELTHEPTHEPIPG
jgi:hypothetical protein